MSKDSWRPEWHSITNTLAHQLTGSCDLPGQVFQYPVTDLPLQMQKLPGLYAAYVSGYVTSSLSPEGVTVLGEVVAARAEGAIGKAYNFVFGLSGSGLYFNGPYKYFDGHHYPLSGAMPTEKAFGNIPLFSEENKGS